MSLGDLFDMELEWGEEKKEVEINAPSLFKEMKKELKEFLLGQQFEGDSTEGAFDLLGNLKKDYKKILMKLLEETPKKKSMIRSLMRILTLLLNTKVDSVNKIKRILKIAINMTLRLWSGQKWRPNVG